MASPGHSDSKRDKSPHAEEKTPTAAVASGRGDGEEAPAGREGMTRLPRLEVLTILSRETLSVKPYNMEAICRQAQEVWPDVPEEVLRMVADSFNEEARGEFTVFQNWVLGEFEEKGYVEVPEEFIKETEEVRERQGGHIDLYLPSRHFTTVVDDDGTEKLVFSFKKKEKAASSASTKSSEGTIFMTFSSDLEPELKAAFRGEMSQGRSHSKGDESSHAGEKKPTASSGRRGDAEEALAAREGMARLPRLEVVNILSRDPCSIAPYNVDAIRRLAQEERSDVPEEVLRMVADSFNEGMRERFIVFQNWVFGEFQEKGYVEVPEDFIKETEEVRKRQGGCIDLYLPKRHFTTVVDDDGSEKLVFSFKKKEKAVSESNSKDDNIFLSYSAKVERKLLAAIREMSLESSEEEESDEDEEGDSDEDD